MGINSEKILLSKKLIQCYDSIAENCKKEYILDSQEWDSTQPYNSGGGERDEIGALKSRATGAEIKSFN